ANEHRPSSVAQWSISPTKKELADAARTQVISTALDASQLWASVQCRGCKPNRGCLLARVFAMLHRVGIWTTACCAWLLLAAPAAAENWSGWRGPRGDGTSLEENLPITWSATENVAWKIEVPGLGHSSPVIWEDKIFLTTCLPESEERLLLCLDRTSGELLWKQTVVTCPLEVKHNLNSHASGTPVTDGKLVYVAFLEIDGSTELATRNVGRVRPL